jgi:hypothetical protein
MIKDLIEEGNVVATELHAEEELKKLNVFRGGSCGVYQDGKFYNTTTLTEIRNRLIQ